MQIKPVALLTGPYDWDPALLPIAEFEARLAAVRSVMATHRASMLIVHGNSSEHGALPYLTNFVPKLGPAFALISPDAPPRLLVSGAPTMLSAAQRLTWVEDVRPIGDLKNSIQAWLAEFAKENTPQIALWGDSKMALRPYLALKSAIEPRGTILNISAPLEDLRIHKSLVEVKLIRQSCAILAAAQAELRRGFRAGLGARSIAGAAEHAAYRADAQDARVHISARSGSPPQFLDFTDDLVTDPLLARVAVRFAGYWSEVFLTLSATPSPALDAAQRGLAAMLQHARAGGSLAELPAIAEEHVRPYSLHPLVKNAVANSIGLSIEEPSETESAPQPAERSLLQSGGVHTLRCGATGHLADKALVSAMIHVTPSHTEILISSAVSSRA